MTDRTPAPDRDTKSLDALIREAEMTVVESDRRWQQHVQALGPALRQTATQATWGGAVGLGAAAAGWLVVKRLTRGSVRPRRHELAPTPRRSSARRVEALAPRATGWGRVSELGGLLLGSAMRAGLAPANGKAGVPLALSAALPLLARWWKSRTKVQPEPRSGIKRPVPGAAAARPDRSAPRA